MASGHSAQTETQRIAGRHFEASLVRRAIGNANIRDEAFLSCLQDSSAMKRAASRRGPSQKLTALAAWAEQVMMSPERMVYSPLEGLLFAQPFRQAQFPFPHRRIVAFRRGRVAPSLFTEPSVACHVALVRLARPSVRRLAKKIAHLLDLFLHATRPGDWSGLAANCFSSAHSERHFP